MCFYTIRNFTPPSIIFYGVIIDIVTEDVQMERLDRTLIKYVFNVLHSDNRVVRTIVRSKCMSSRSMYVNTSFHMPIGNKISIMYLVKLKFPPNHINYNF